MSHQEPMSVEASADFLQAIVDLCLAPSTDW